LANDRTAVTVTKRLIGKYIILTTLAMGGVNGGKTSNAKPAEAGFARARFNTITWPA